VSFLPLNLQIIFHFQPNLFRFKDFTEIPVCESAISCDNLVCDAHGKPPNPSIVVQVRMSQNGGWIKYGRTEVVEVKTTKH
jgi:hypothetical protein